MWKAECVVDESLSRGCVTYLSRAPKTQAARFQSIDECALVDRRQLSERERERETGTSREREKDLERYTLCGQNETQMLVMAIMKLAKTSPMGSGPSKRLVRGTKGGLSHPRARWSRARRLWLFPLGK